MRVGLCRVYLSYLYLPSLLVVVCLIGFVLARMFFSYPIGLSGRLVAFGCEVWDETRTKQVTRLDWGEVIIGYTYNQVLWIHNNGTSARPQNLTWTHDAPSYLRFEGWWFNATSQTWEDWISIPFPRGQWVKVKFSLTPLPNATLGEFEFTIWIQVEASLLSRFVR